MSSIYTSDVQLGVLPSTGSIYTSHTQLGAKPTPAELSTGAFNVTAEGGVSVTGLTVGKYYTINAVNGPWEASVSGIPGRTDDWGFAVSNDGGSSWSGRMGWGDFDSLFETAAPSWATGAVALDSLRAQMGWVATTTSIKVRVGDNPDDFADNSGALDWSLKEGFGGLVFGVRLG